MTEWLLCVGAVLLLLAMWAYMNHWYRLIHGAPLRWPYLWAAHGAVLFAKRFPRWEKR